jgi:nucleoside-diphosphate-sugar epimerase
LTSPETTNETSEIEIEKSSHYGFNKLLAEQLVRHHAKRWLILRLAGMVGENLRKNPVFDILNDKPLFIHPDSQYQFMPTDAVAKIAIDMFEKNIEGEIFNLCGDGLISPREIAEIAGREITLSEESRVSSPRIVDVNIEKIKNITSLPQTRQSVIDFIKECEANYER